MADKQILLIVKYSNASFFWRNAEKKGFGVKRAEAIAVPNQLLEIDSKSVL